jgi:hypothetical protein
MARAPRKSPPVVIDPLADDAPASVPAVPEPDPGPDLTGPVDERGRPLPEDQLTPEQKQIRYLQDQLARERGSKDPEQELAAPAQPGAEGNILIHFLEDGFTALGAVWYRGQELEFEPDSPAYRDTCDRTGWTWLSLAGDDFAQVKRYGKIYFRRGPWPGEPLAAAAGVAYDTPGAPKPSEEELERAERAEARRNRAAPRLPIR